MLSLRPLEHLANFALRAALDRHPEVFDRLGPYAGRRYLLDVTDTPFTLLLLIGEQSIRIHRRSKNTAADAVIRGKFLTLARLAQGGGDGDGLFFSRDITIEGDTEAVLALRNALDDAGLDIIDDSLEALGFWGSPFRLAYKALKEARPVIGGMFAP
jgi:predicted lipid carrier protein YhbT